MPNRILDAYVTTYRADPTGAELRVMVRPEAITPATQIKGRLMGPRSTYASTVEIAYPYRELARTDHILLRVQIPEPNFWEPTTPLLYEGPLELWEQGERCEQITLRHGMRSVQLGPQGLRVNSKPAQLNGVQAETITEADARRWHGEGVNLVMIPARDDVMDLWKFSDRFGLFVLGRIEEPHQWPRWALASQRHVSFFGTVVPAGQVDHRTSTNLGLCGIEVAADGTVASAPCDFLLVPSEGRFAIVPAQASPQVKSDQIGWIRLNSAV